jgi:hypothetical protein
MTNVLNKQTNKHKPMQKDNIFRFTDKCTYSFVEFEKSDLITWINSHYVDPDNCKLFMLLLKSSFDDMKLVGCTEYRQLVLQTDWDDFLSENKEWSIVEKYESGGEVPATMLVSCNIDVANELVIDGFLRNNKTF